LFDWVKIPIDFAYLQVEVSGVEKLVSSITTAVLERMNLITPYQLVFTSKRNEKQLQQEWTVLYSNFKGSVTALSGDSKLQETFCSIAEIDMHSM